MAYKILFVCLGNICRSPAAENIMNYLINQAGLNNQIICDSAGTAGYHIGSPPDRRMTMAAKNKQVEMIGAARKLTVDDLANFDLILAMDGENYRDILSLDHSGKYRQKIKKMCDFCINYQSQEVPDPYYGGVSGFEYVIDLLFDACQGLLDHLKTTENIS